MRQRTNNLLWRKFPPSLPERLFSVTLLQLFWVRKQRIMDEDEDEDGVALTGCENGSYFSFSELLSFPFGRETRKQLPIKWIGSAGVLPGSDNSLHITHRCQRRDYEIKKEKKKKKKKKGWWRMEGWVLGDGSGGGGGGGVCPWVLSVEEVQLVASCFSFQADAPPPPDKLLHHLLLLDPDGDVMET
ncbi:unnamed protein product [Pleuronectes platessa]|uniref:Uncharacterized protein n=1 Tax=Pleuronectes platessa TaxID=8262 RepID=A0A9N7YV03_PLEPL|nr:unnamed protein product [Pleuronectes platessa]